MMSGKQWVLVLVVVLTILRSSPGELDACTAIVLKAQDGAVLVGRTMEWGTFDLKSRVVIVPRGHRFTSVTPDGKPGKSWRAKYGAVAIDAIEKDIFMDGINEKGLTVSLLYHPGFAEYQKYDPARASDSLAPIHMLNYLLTSAATVEEARAAIQAVRVVPVVEKAFGSGPAPGHMLVCDRSGKSIVIEYLKGKLKIFDAPLGVLTNAPSYDWHITNLRNYVNLSVTGLPLKKIENLNLKPLGGGAGMIGLPGDHTPVSRFIRAVAWTQTARPLADGPDGIYEVFRILDNFNVPLGASEGHGKLQTAGMRSSTLWTVAYDTKNLVVYYHTQHNRRVRKLELARIDFTRPRGLFRMPLDKERKQDIEDVTPTVLQPSGR